MADSGITNITNLLGLIKDKNVSTSDSSTTSSNISSEGMNALIQQILGGTQGLASVASGQKTSGLYNSTVNQQLINDLVTRTSGELAKQQAGTTTTRTSKQSTAAPLGSLGNILPTALLLKSIMGSSAGKKVGKSVGNALGLDTFSANANAVTDFLSGQSSISPSALMSANSTADPLGTLIASQGWSGAETAGALSTGADALAGIGSALMADGTIVGASEVGGMLAAANATADPLGAFIGSLGFDVSAAGAGSAAATAAGAAEAATAVAGAAEGAGLFETVMAVLAWVICTELNSQGKLPNRFYVYGAQKFATYGPQELRGYYIWAIPSVRHLRKHPDSLYSKFLEKLFYARAEYLAAQAGCKKAKKTFWGAVATGATFVFCWTLGAFVPEKNWRVLYG